MWCPNLLLHGDSPDHGAELWFWPIDSSPMSPSIWLQVHIQNWKFWQAGNSSRQSKFKVMTMHQSGWTEVACTLWGTGSFPPKMQMLTLEFGQVHHHIPLWDMWARFEFQDPDSIAAGPYFMLHNPESPVPYRKSPFVPSFVSIEYQHLQLLYQSISLQYPLIAILHHLCVFLPVCRTFHWNDHWRRFRASSPNPQQFLISQSRNLFSCVPWISALLLRWFYSIVAVQSRSKWVSSSWTLTTLYSGSHKTSQDPIKTPYCFAVRWYTFLPPTVAPTYL